MKAGDYQVQVHIIRVRDCCCCCCCLLLRFVLGMEAAACMR